MAKDHHHQCMFLAALQEFTPEVLQGLMELYEQAPQDEKGAIESWCVRFNLLDIGQPCPWLVEAAAATMAAWRSVPSMKGYFDLPEGESGWSDRETVDLSLSWSAAAPSFVKQSQIAALRQQLAAIESDLPRAERWSVEPYRWLAFQKVRKATLRELANGANMTRDGVKAAMRRLKHTLSLRDLPGRPTTPPVPPI